MKIWMWKKNLGCVPGISIFERGTDSSQINRQNRLDKGSWTAAETSAIPQRALKLGWPFRDTLEWGKRGSALVPEISHSRARRAVLRESVTLRRGQGQLLRTTVLAAQEPHALVLMVRSGLDAHRRWVFYPGPWHNFQFAEVSFVSLKSI